MLTIHEIVAHATELDRIMGYEANYAGTSFVKVSDLGKLKYGSKLFNVTADKTIPGGLGTIGYDDDGVKTTKFPIVRDGILVGLMTNRETAHYINEKESRGCTYASSWRDYPFLRMANVHVEPGPPGSPTLEQIIADTKDGVLIDGRGSYSIDQQRYNGQFGGNAFWEIKNGKKTRHGDQRHLQRDHHRLLGQPGRADRSATSGRCTAPAATPRGSRRRPTASRTARPTCGSRRSWSARRTPDVGSWKLGAGNWQLISNAPSVPSMRRWSSSAGSSARVSSSRPATSRSCSTRRCWSSPPGAPAD